MTLLTISLKVYSQICLTLAWADLSDAALSAFVEHLNIAQARHSERRRLYENSVFLIAYSPRFLRSITPSSTSLLIYLWAVFLLISNAAATPVCDSSDHRCRPYLKCSFR